MDLPFGGGRDLLFWKIVGLLLGEWNLKGQVWKRDSSQDGQIVGTVIRPTVTNQDGSKGDRKSGARLGIQSITESKVYADRLVVQGNERRAIRHGSHQLERCSRTWTEMVKTQECSGWRLGGPGTLANWSCWGLKALLTYVQRFLRWYPKGWLPWSLPLISASGFLLLSQGCFQAVLPLFPSLLSLTASVPSFHGPYRLWFQSPHSTSLSSLYLSSIQGSCPLPSALFLPVSTPA